MLVFYQTISGKLRPLQPLWFALAALSFCWLGYLLLVAPVAISQRWQLTALVTFAFLLNLMLLPLLFSQSHLQHAPSDRWGRLREKLHAVALYLLAWLITLLFVVILWLFLRIAMGIIIPLIL